MNFTKIALLAAASLLLAACGPKNLPNQWSNPSTGSRDSVVNDGESISSDEETLTADNPDDVRNDSAAGEKVSSWIENNTIPESAKLAVVFFGFDKFNVEASERSKLDAIADAVKNGGANIYIVGYSDYFGTEEYNLALSDKRAQAVKNYLKNLGADDSSQVQALGEAYAVQNGDKNEVSQDRKVIVVDGDAQ